MAVTTKDLAEICGVSRATVTRALHGKGRISEETKQLILETACRLGYEPDLTARTLASGKSMMIGVTIVDLNNLYFPRIVDAIEKKVMEENYLLNITLHEDSREMEQRLVRTLVGHRVDGLIMNPVNKGESFWKMMENIRVPYCILGVDELPGCPAVGVDELAAGEAAAKYLLEKGYRDIVFVAPQLYDDLGLPNFGHLKRWLGVQNVLREADCHCSLITGKFDYSSKMLDYLRRGNPRKTAFLCSGAVYAADAMRLIGSCGFLPPNDYGIMAFDQIDLYQNNGMRLTCLDNHPELQGYYAGDMLVKMIQGVQTEKRIVIPFEIIEGQTL